MSLPNLLSRNLCAALLERVMGSVFVQPSGVFGLL